MNFYCTYTSFEKTDLEIREKTAISSNESTLFYRFLKRHRFAEEFFFLSTCNRTEIYYLSEVDKTKEFICLLSEFKNDPGILKTGKNFCTLNNPEEVINRLFAVSNGIYSQVLGDLQIIDQIRTSYIHASKEGCIGTYLHELLQMVFSCYKEIANQTQMHSGSASISYAAMEIVRDFLKKDKRKSILIIGAGTFAREVIEQLKKKDFHNITVANCTYEKAKELADRYHLTSIPFDELDDIWCFHAIISCVNARQYIINKKYFEINSPSLKLLIDLSVPRSIDPALGLMKGIKLINMGQIKEKNQTALQKRKDSIGNAFGIIDEYMKQYCDWLKMAKSRPVISDLKSAIEEISQSEISRHLKKHKLKDTETQLIKNVTASIINKIVKRPARQLNANWSDIEKLSEALIMLFDLKNSKDLVTPGKYSLRN